MRAKLYFPAAMVLTFFGLALARGQTPYPLGPAPEGVPMPAVVMEGSLPQPGTSPVGPPAYVTYRRPDCCGPVGGDGPVLEELFVRGGVSLPVSGTIFGH